MAVLVEALSVVVRLSTLDNRFSGGRAAFWELVPNATFCFDERLARVAFMTPADVGAFISVLERHGLVFQQDDAAIDIAVVDQFQGPTLRCPWLEFGRVDHGDHEVSACWLAGAEREEVAVPEGWRFAGSKSERSGFVQLDEFGGRLKWVRHERGCDVYVDERTGQESFIGRPKIAGDTEPAIHTQLRWLFHRALEAEREIGDAERDSELGSIEHRLRDLLAEADVIVRGPGQEMALAYFVRGLVLRVLQEYAPAEGSFRTAHELNPTHLNTLLELVLCLGEQGRNEEALPFALQAAAVDPSSAAAMGNLAITLFRCGDREEASRAIRRALEIEPADQINRNILRLIEAG